MLDERFTTRIAEEAMRASNVSSRKQRPVVDKVAATLLLQSYLDSHPASEEADPGQETL